MFHKLVAIEPVSLVPSAEKELYSFAEEVILFPDVPAGDEEVAARIGDADAVLLSYTSRITRLWRNVRMLNISVCAVRSILPKVPM